MSHDEILQGSKIQILFALLPMLNDGELARINQVAHSRLCAAQENRGGIKIVEAALHITFHSSRFSLSLPGAFSIPAVSSSLISCSPFSWNGAYGHRVPVLIKSFCWVTPPPHILEFHSVHLQKIK